MSYKRYKSKVQVIKTMNSIKDRTMKMVFRVLSFLLFPIWIPIFLINKVVVTIRQYLNKIRNNKITEGRDIRKDKSFKENMKIIYGELLDSKEYTENSCIYISTDKLGDHLAYGLLGEVVDNSYRS